MKKFAVIVAGGTGERMNASVPKQFLLIKKKPVLFYTINSFLKAYNDIQIILVVPEEHIAKSQEIIDGYFYGSKIQLTNGGRTRFDSVKNGLSLIAEESIIFVHDGVRCLVTPQLIHKCFEAAEKYGTAIPVINCKDSVRLVNENGNEALERKAVKLVQTPQTFHSQILLEAYKIDYKNRFTDEATVVEAFGLKVNLVEGEETNIKITRPIDLILAEKILEGPLIF
jgi:2-C-methyl-D-erythritol 4-phosphate cytidylyltransferase